MDGEPAVLAAARRVSRPPRGQVNGYVRYVDHSFKGITINFFWQDDKLNGVSAGCDFSCTLSWNEHNADPPPPLSQYCDEDHQYQCQHSLRIHVTIDPTASSLHPAVSV
jgi:hypothetical protein